MFKKPIRIFVSAGEASGDLHGASLIKELKRIRADIEVYGLGGPRMAEVGCELHRDMVKVSGMWFWHVWANFFHYLGVLREVVSGLVTNPPDAVVLIDSPGFNMRIAAHAKARGIPVIYYITPQAWAWASMRCPKIARRVDKMLNILSFEPDFWRRFGLNCEYVGHPIFDHLESLKLAPVQRVSDPKAPLIGLLPGSRYREIDDLLPIMLRAAGRIKASIPGAKFRVVCSNESLSGQIHGHVAETAQKDAPIGPVDIQVGSAHDLMRQATLCLVSCGTANLELAYFGTPMVVLYRMVWYGFWAKSIFVSSDYISLVNILMGREVAPECLMLTANASWVADRALGLLQDEKARQKCLSDLEDFRKRFAHPGASRRAAQEIAAIVETAAADKGSPAQTIGPDCGICEGPR